jgi:hypothetical protein
MAMTETTETGKKDRILKREYRMRDGTITEKLGPDVDAFICTVLDTGEKVTCELADSLAEGQDLPDPSMLMCLAAFGAQTTVGNAVTSVKDGDNDKRLRAMQDRWDGIKEGEWRSGAEGGPRLRYVLEAWAIVQGEKQGKPCNDKQLAFMREKLIAEGTKKYLENAKIAAAYAAEEVKRAIENKKRKQAAVEADEDAADELEDVPA